MKNILKTVIFYSVIALVLPLYGLGMLLLLVAAMVTSAMCNFMED